jgi:polygalacturonase
MQRRQFLASVALAGGWPALGRSIEPDPVEAIRARIKPPVFPARNFEITKYGARPGVDSAQAIAKAISACHEVGGGRVVVPAGVFLTGAIHLRSGVNLHLAADATLRFSSDPKAYLPAVFTRWEGNECMNYSPLIYAFEQCDVAITGAGTLDGTADEAHWWAWKGRGAKPGEPTQAADRDALVAMATAGKPVAERVFGAGHYLRPQFIQPYRCENVLIEGVTIVNSPMWEIHPVLCRNVTVRGVTINSHGPNNDGCDPESCTDVLIGNCIFDTGDDCIAIKSGRNADGRRLHALCQNLIIEDCTMRDGHGGVSIGSEASGGVRNVFVRNCRMSSPHLERALRIKTNSYRGGTIENVSFRDVTIGQVAQEVVQIDFSYEEGEGGPFPPTVRNITLENVTCEKSERAWSLRGYATAPIRDVRVSRCRFDAVRKENLVEHVEGLVVAGSTINGRPV